MRSPWDIPLESRTVWICLACIGLGASKLFFPEDVTLDQFSVGLILFGLVNIYQRSTKKDEEKED